MAIQRTATPIPDFASLKPHDLVNTAQAAALIASRDLRPGDDARTAKNRAQKALTNAIKQGVLKTVSPRHFRTDDLGQFLQKRWPGEFDDMPAGNVIEVPCVHLKITAHAPTIHNGPAIVFPTDVPRCHSEIKKLAAHIDRLQTELDAARDRARGLLPDADKWRAWCQKNKQSAGKKRGKARKV